MAEGSALPVGCGPLVTFLGFVPLAEGRVYVAPGTTGLVISAEVMATLLRWRQEEGADEACGVLVGRESHDGALMVDAASEPGPADVREPRACERHDPCHQQLIVEAYAECRAVRFVGSWHTHSEPIPTPSHVDVDGWIEEVGRVTEQFGPGFRFACVIVGQTHVGVWGVHVG